MSKFRRSARARRISRTPRRGLGGSVDEHYAHAERVFNQLPGYVDRINAELAAGDCYAAVSMWGALEARAAAGIEHANEIAASMFPGKHPETSIVDYAYTDIKKLTNDTWHKVAARCVRKKTF